MRVTNEPPSAKPLPAVTLRSILIGLAGVCFVCGLAAYNDFAMDNTFLIGNFLPIGLLLIVLTLVVGVNVPLHRYFPSKAIRQGELAVIVLMVLVSCSVPSSGLMRYLPSSLTGIYIGAAERRADWGPAVDAAKVPEWLLPKVDGATAAEKGYQDVFTQFRARAPDGQVPWSAWVRPIFTWGIVVAFIWGLLISISLIVRKQWTENERLSFPLATIYQSLIETPAPGQSLNTLFRSTGFWIAAGSVFVIHSLNALNKYDPTWPNVPLTYDFQTMLVDPPWAFTTWGFKTATIYFSMIGIAFFMQTKTSFSIWFFFLLWQISEMLMGTVQLPVSEMMRQDQTFGGIIVFAAVILYVGRYHWWMVIRHMFGQQRPGEHDGTYLPYAVVGWAAAICFAGVVVWLRCAGVWFGAGIAITVLLVTLFMVIARALADTGLMFVQVNFQLHRAFYYPVLVPAEPHYTTQTNFFFATWFTELFHDLRESLAAFFQLGIRITDETVMPRQPRRSTGLGLIMAVVLALFVAYFVSWAGMLNMEYRYAQTSTSTAVVPNIYGIETSVRPVILEPSTAYLAHTLTQESRNPIANPLLQVGIGAAIVGVCSVLRLLLSWWPFHPIAFIVLYSFATSKIWFSIFIGWVAKVFIIRLGGASLLKAGRNVFIGLIVGEAFASAFWLVVNLIRNANGLEYKALMFLPG